MVQRVGREVVKEAVLKAFKTANRQGKTIVVPNKVVKNGKNLNIRKWQMDDPELKGIMLYLEDRELPRDEKRQEDHYMRL